MKRTMFALLAVGILALVTNVTLPQGNSSGTIVIGVNGQGGCVVKSHTEKMRAKRGVAVRWRVEMDSAAACGPGHRVSVGNFLYQPSGQSKHPFETPPGQSPPVGQGGVTIVATVRSDADAGTYKYSIFLDGNEELDPELEVDR